MKKTQLQSHICIFSACLLMVMGVVQLNTDCVLNHSSELEGVHDHSHATANLCDHHHEDSDYYIQSIAAVAEVKALERLIGGHAVAETPIENLCALHDKAGIVAANSNRHRIKNFNYFTMVVLESVVILS